MYEGVSLFKKKLFRRYATSHLSILTEREMILIKESAATRKEAAFSEDDTTRSYLYGGVLTYIPRPKIKNVSFVPDTHKSLCTMEIVLSENTKVISEFSMKNASLNAFQQSCHAVS